MDEVMRIAVVGAGTMGSGIALVAATHGLEVTLLDVDDEPLARARSYHARTLDRGVEKGRITRDEADEAIARISIGTDMAAVAGAGCVIEAATENAQVKETIFGRMLAAADPGAILATNTSSISITGLAGTAGSGKDRVIGMHFFNPVPVMKLVEIIRGEATSEDTLRRTTSLAQRMGKTPILANDSAGFVSNRVLMPMINEAFHAWTEGVAEAEAIDGIMELGCNFPMGPLRLADLIGLDVCRDIMLVMLEAFGDERFRPSPRLEELVAAGRLGRKSGRGVYDYAAG